MRRSFASLPAVCVACFGIVRAAPQSCLLQREQVIAGGIHSEKALIEEHFRNPEETSVNTADLAGKFEEMMRNLDESTTKGLNSTSPEVVATIEKFVQELDTMAKPKFQAALKETQAAIDAAVAEVKTATDQLVAAKAPADKTNQQLVAARKDEKSKLEISEKCRTNSEWFNQTRDATCKEMSEGQYHEWDVDNSFSKMQRCDLGLETCYDLDTLIDQIDEHLANVEAERESYKEKVTACETAQQRSITEEATCAQGRAEFAESKLKADMQEWNTKKQLCEFGASLQQKCDKYRALMDVIEEAKEGKGTAYSEADREAQWNKVMTWKCMLQSYAGQGATDKQTFDTCKGSVDYAADIGTLSYKSSEIAATTQPASTKYTCQEASVRVSGGRMTEGEQAHDYHFSKLWEIGLTLTPVGAAPFNFCQPEHSKADCKGFICPAEHAAKPDATCALQRCTIFDCCEGAAGKA